MNSRKGFDNQFIFGHATGERNTHQWSDQHCHFRVIDPKGKWPEFGNYCVCRYHPTAEVRVLLLQEWVKLGYIERVNGSAAGMQDPVLIRIGQFGQKPKVCFEWEWVVVRLQTLDQCLGRWVHSIDSPFLTLGESVFRVGVALDDDRELGALCDLIANCRPDLSMMGFNQCEVNVIERATQIMKYIPDDQRERVVRWLDSNADSVFDIVTGVLNWLESKRRFTFGLDPIGDLRPQLLQVILRPVEFKNKAVIWGGHDRLFLRTLGLSAKYVIAGVSSSLAGSLILA